MTKLRMMRGNQEQQIFNIQPHSSSKTITNKNSTTQTKNHFYPPALPPPPSQSSHASSSQSHLPLQILQIRRHKSLLCWCLGIQFIFAKINFHICYFSISVFVWYEFKFVEGTIKRGGLQRSIDQPYKGQTPPKNISCSNQLSMASSCADITIHHHYIIITII